MTNEAFRRLGEGTLTGEYCRNTGTPRMEATEAAASAQVRPAQQQQLLLRCCLRRRRRLRW